jgi:Flp pilus assembly protein TadG
MRFFSGLVNRFRRDQRGNIAVIFGIACIPVLSAIGCGVDYSEASRMRAKLQSAADAAAVASISQNSQGWLAASLMTGNGAVSTAQTDAMNIFLGNINNVYNPGNPSANLFTLNTSGTAATVTKTGANLTSTVTFNASVPTIFMNVVGFKSLTVAGSSSASSSLPLYLDFYVMLDVSGSMGLPSDTNGQSALNNVNPDNYGQYPTGCTLACHFSVANVCSDTGSNAQKFRTNNYCMGFAFSRVDQTALTNLLNVKATKNGVNNSTALGFPDSMIPGLPGSLNTDPTYGIPKVSSCPNPTPYASASAGDIPCIQLRVDAVGFALNATKAANGISGLFESAKNDAVVTGQFRIGLYPFIQDVYSYFPLTSQINGSPTNTSTINYAAANLVNLLDTNTNSSLGSGGTNITQSIGDINNIVPSGGDGSSPSKTLPYVFLITDGAVDPQTKQLNTSGGWSGSNHATTISSNPSPCAALTGRGVKVMVLYIPYTKIANPNPNFANDEDDYANNNIANIPASLQACASPADSSGSYMYTANTPAQINQAIVAMFNHALVTAHLTN